MGIKRRPSQRKEKEELKKKSTMEGKTLQSPYKILILQTHSPEKESMNLEPPMRGSILNKPGHQPLG